MSESKISYISAWRARARLTQQQLADALGVTRQYIAKLECGLVSMDNITFARAIALANALGVEDIRDLLKTPRKEQSAPIPNSGYRVSLAPNFPHIEATALEFIHAGTYEEAVAIARRVKKEGYQSKEAGNEPMNPNLAVIERWSAEEQEWLFAD